MENLKTIPITQMSQQNETAPGRIIQINSSKIRERVLLRLLPNIRTVVSIIIEIERIPQMCINVYLPMGLVISVNLNPFDNILVAMN